MKKEEKIPDGGQREKGDTVTAQGEDQAARPRTPNERDESADSQAAPASAENRRLGKIAHDDLAEGQKDTDKGPVLDATYEKLTGGKND